MVSVNLTCISPTHSAYKARRKVHTLDLVLGRNSFFMLTRVFGQNFLQILRHNGRMYYFVHKLCKYFTRTAHSLLYEGERKDDTPQQNRIHAIVSTKISFTEELMEIMNGVMSHF